MCWAPSDETLKSTTAANTYVNVAIDQVAATPVARAHRQVQAAQREANKGGIYSYEREVPPEAERENPGEHDSKGNVPSRHTPHTAVGF
jgi:hypothetical protein